MMHQSHPERGLFAFQGHWLGTSWAKSAEVDHYRTRVCPHGGKNPAIAVPMISMIIAVMITSDRSG